LSYQSVSHLDVKTVAFLSEYIILRVSTSLWGNFVSCQDLHYFWPVDTCQKPYGNQWRLLSSLCCCSLFLLWSM